VFAVCWGGVYLGTRTFLPMLLAADEGHVVNTSSVNGLWACLGPNGVHTSYSAAKFAVRGFTESLIVDFRVNAPHLRASVVMPGHIGTSIVFNSGQYFGRHPKELPADEIARIRAKIAARGIDVAGASDEDIRGLVVQQAESFRDNAPMTASQAATVILNGVRNNEWRILVGDDAHVIDDLLRAEPGNAYEPSFTAALQSRGAFGFIPN
jgi:NAD(P)-dependent dehydrogenase (short-subunit alcohol dehydrogenase family)